MDEVIESERALRAELHERIGAAFEALGYQTSLCRHAGNEQAVEALNEVRQALRGETDER